MRDYGIKKISKRDTEDILKKFHYLSKQGFSFRSGFNYGLFIEDKLIGVAVFHTLSVPETAKGCFGLQRNEQQGLYELGRLVLDPEEYEPNLTSWFLSRAIKILRKEIVNYLMSYRERE